MKDLSNTNSKLIEEISALKQRIKEMEKSGVALKLVEEDLRRHQVELEMQNDELRRKKAEPETAGDSHFDFYDLAPVGYCTVSKQGLILRFTPTIPAMLGGEGDVLVKQPIARFIFKEDQTIYYRHRKQLFETGEPQACELRMVRMDGTLFWAHLAATAAQDADGVPMYRFVLSDITERKHAEGKLKQQTNAMEASIDGIAILDEEQNYIYVNKAHAKIYGYDISKELIGQSWRILYYEDELQRFDRDIMPELSEKGEWQGEATGRKKDGTIFPQEISLTALDNGGLICVVHDITSRKLAGEKLKETTEKLRKTLIDVIQAMSLTVETRDPYTAGHQKRVSNLARVIAQEMALPKDTIDTIRMAGVLHDLGKIAVPSEILSKPTMLSEIEFSLIKVHAQRGYDILKDVGLPYPMAEAVLQHHERLDGSGYPQGLKNNQIFMEAKILSVADVVEAIASHRPYRPAQGVDTALEEIEKNKGILYDAGVVEVCVRLFREKKFSFE